MINKDYLKEELKNLSSRVVADKNWKREQRKLLLSQLNAQTDEVIDLESEKELHIFSSFKMLLKPVFLLLIFVLGSGYLGVMASEQSLPGDLLYSVKITSEKAKAGLTFDKNKKTKLHVELAQKRVDEIKQLKEQAEVANEPLAEELIEETYNKIKEEIQETKNILNVLKLENANGNFDNTTDLVKIVEHVDSSMKMITDYLAEMLDEDKKKELSEEKIKFLEKDMVQGILKDVKDLRSDVKIIIKEVVMKQADKLDQDYEVSEAISKIIGRSVSALNEKSDQLISDLNKEDLEILVEEYADEYVNEYMNENKLLNIINERISDLEMTTEEVVEEIPVSEQAQEEVVEEVIKEDVVEEEVIDEEVVEEVEVDEEVVTEEEVIEETDENIEENSEEVNNEEEITNLDVETETESEVNSNEEVIVEEDVLSVVKDLLKQENLVTSLEDSKQLVDVLNQEIFVLIENGEFDKALEYLEASEYIVANMTEESNEEEVIAEEESSENQTEESEEVATEEATTENTEEEEVVEENTTETQTETTNEEEVIVEEESTNNEEEVLTEEPATETQTETTTETE